MYWQSALQRSAIYCGEPAARGHVDMLQSTDVREAVVKSITVDIDVSNARVVDIYVAEIAPSGAVPGDERLTESERAPSEAAAVSEANSTETNSDTPARAAVPAD